MKFSCSNLEAGKGGCTACHLQSVQSLGGLRATENRTVTLVNELLREVGLDVRYVECHHGVGCLMLFFVFGVVLYADPPFVPASGSSLPRRQSYACIQPHRPKSILKHGPATRRRPPSKTSLRRRSRRATTSVVCDFHITELDCVSSHLPFSWSTRIKR